MNTPNKLTLLRVIMVPIFMALVLCESVGMRVAALVVFIIASLTDMLDGQIARKNNQVTSFGKFADPLADKLLTSSAFIVFTYMKLISPWVLLIVLLREFTVSGVRLVAAGTGKVIAASFWGKLKTVFQMAAIIITLLIIIVPIGDIGNIIINAVTWISTALALISGVDYVWKNRSLITFK